MPAKIAVRPSESETGLKSCVRRLPPRCLSEACPGTDGETPIVRVGLFVTCLGDTLFPSAGQAVVRLLERLGTRSSSRGADLLRADAPEQRLRRRGLALARRFAAVFEGYEAVVTPSASCAGWCASSSARMSPLYELSELLVDVLAWRTWARTTRTG